MYYMVSSSSYCGCTCLHYISLPRFIQLIAVRRVEILGHDRGVWASNCLSVPTPRLDVHFMQCSYITPNARDTGFLEIV
jgi:hypothetical protein